MATNGHLQVVVAEFEERQCPVGHDGQERSGDNAHHCTRNAICKLLWAALYSFPLILGVSEGDTLGSPNQI